MVGTTNPNICSFSSTVQSCHTHALCCLGCRTILINWCPSKAAHSPSGHYRYEVLFACKDAQRPTALGTALAMSRCCHKDRLGLLFTAHPISMLTSSFHHALSSSCTPRCWVRQSEQRLSTASVLKSDSGGEVLEESVSNVMCNIWASRL
ncbi:hypothetical protein CB0940_03047 [Cercospora beticola]|uniref:Uncharacterized protein n=1 Tax=Cercospora beticola TaxID=122368 RepID=A0A2G5I3N5_CERBT|nr:hypothetical protein CB0940_03047 [Cercospora beticola]PIA99399.1 hypothetical protein CB0940_03047 [Cercospora beticola]